MKHFFIVLFVSFLVAGAAFPLSSARADITSNEPSTAQSSLTTCANNSGCSSGVCSTVHFTDRTLKICTACNLSGAAQCSSGSCNAASGLCSDQSGEASESAGPGTCQTHQECVDTRGANWRCLPVGGGSQKACVLSPNPEDLQEALGSGQPCTVGGAQECPGGEACVPLGEDSSAGFCATSPAYGSNPLTNVLRFTSVEDLLVGMLDAVVQIGAILLVLAIVYVGFLFVKAQGKEEEIKQAREAFVWTVIGGLLVLGAQGLSLVLQATVQSL